MDITELLGVAKPNVEESQYSPDEAVAEDVEVVDAEVIIDESAKVDERLEQETHAIITGLEGLYQLVDREINNSIYAFRNLSGCESFANGILSCYGGDLTRVSGTEGFVDSVVNGFKAIIDWIKNALKSVWDFFFGKSAEEKFNDSIKKHNDVVKEWNDLIKDVDVNNIDKETEEKIKTMAKRRRDTMKDVEETQEKTGGFVISLENRKKTFKIYDDFVEGKTGINEFLAKLANANPLTIGIMNEATAKGKDEANKAKSKNAAAESKVNNLKADDKAAKESIKEELNEAKKHTENVKEAAKVVNEATTTNQVEVSILKTATAYLKKKKASKKD